MTRFYSKTGYTLSKDILIKATLFIFSKPKSFFKESFWTYCIELSYIWKTSLFIRIKEMFLTLPHPNISQHAIPSHFCLVAKCDCEATGAFNGLRLKLQI